jgi:hypothetical protein
MYSLRIIFSKFVCYFIGNMKRKSSNILWLCFIMVFQVYAVPENLFLIKKYKPLHAIHPVHISFTNIEYNQQKGKFEILFKFFIDDFNLILKNKFGKDLQLASGKWDNSYLHIINSYIFEHFKFIVNDKDKTKSSLKFVRKEKTEDSFCLYYDFNAKEKNNNFVVHNSFFNDLYMDQNNLLIFTYKGEQKAYKFDRSNIKEMFSF